MGVVSVSLKGPEMAGPPGNKRRANPPIWGLPIRGGHRPNLGWLREPGTVTISILEPRVVTVNHA